MISGLKIRTLVFVHQPLTCGPYELLRKLAAGGMAEVFLARERGSAGFFRDIAVKRLFRNFATEEQPLQLFQQEAHLLSLLSHPGIPQVYTLGQCSDTWYMSMEYVDGLHLADLWRAGVRTGHVMPLPVTLSIVVQACHALHHAHEARDRAGRALELVHRDVTPQNLMVSRSGVVKVMDFGVAKIAGRELLGGHGTYSYFSPEQARSLPLDRRSDVFALAIILYEMTTGTRLYSGSEPQVLTQVVENDAALPSSLIPEYPGDLEEIVMAGLRRDRDVRIPSAAELAAHLEYFAMRNGFVLAARDVAAYFEVVLPSVKVPDDDAFVPLNATFVDHTIDAIPLAGFDEPPEPRTMEANIADLRPMTEKRAEVDPYISQLEARLDSVDGSEVSDED